MLVVLAIIGVISAIFIRRTSLESPETKLDLAAQDLATAIRQAQISGTTGSGSDSASAYTSMVDQSSADSLAYGVDLKQGRSTYYLFRDKDRNDYFTSAGDSWLKYDLPPGVNLSKVTVSAVGCACNTTSQQIALLFKTPFITFAKFSCGVVVLNSCSPTVTLKLTANGATKSRSVTINPAGVLQVTTTPP